MRPKSLDIELLIVISLFGLSLCATSTFNILSTSICTQTSGPGYCMRWEQNGTVQEQTPSCFPADAQVITDKGPKRFDQVAIGDQILGVSGFTKVTGWLHRETHADRNYIRVEVSDNEYISVSEKHNIALEDGSYRLAEETVGEKLLIKRASSGRPHQTHLTFNSFIKTANSVGGIAKLLNIPSLGSKLEAKIIVSPTGIVLNGAFSPLTEGFNYYVLSESGNVMVLAHCFAHVRNPTRYQWVISSSIRLWSLFGGDSNPEQETIKENSDLDVSSTNSQQQEQNQNRKFITLIFEQFILNSSAQQGVNAPSPVLDNNGQVIIDAIQSNESPVSIAPAKRAISFVKSGYVHPVAKFYMRCFRWLLVE